MERSFSAATRHQNIEKFSNHEYDLVIIGGGITGAGVARDAASRGMSVALVEMNDFASGTSSRSSKLIHGGIRYLEHLEFGLVFEALSERHLLFEMAPHLVHPLRFLLPLYEGGRVGMFKMGLGMWLYDVLSLFEAPEMHERLNREQSLRRVPVLKEKGLLGSYVYSDAYMDDDRLVLESLRSAQRFGADCANYVKATSADFVNGRVAKIHCRDQLDGRKFSIKGRHYVSTVGPWTDRLGADLFSDWEKIMRPSKGIHLTLRRERLPLPSAVVMASDKDQRIIFGIPRHEMVIVGTTDTDFTDDPADVYSSAADVDYLLEIVGEYFPGAHLKKSDVIASYAGVRPLVRDEAADESATSREHVVISDPRGVTFIAGGKYTTYRKMAQEAVETILNSFSIEDQVRFAQSHTKEPLNPRVTTSRYERAFLEVESWAREFALTVPEVSLLVNRHGEEALDLLSYAKNRNGGGPYSVWEMEAQFAIDQGMCLSLEDFYLRRVPIFLAESDNGLGLLNKLADIFVDKYNWGTKRREAEIKKIHHHIEKELGWKKQ